MFGIINYPAFLFSSILLNMTPGSDTIYILSKSATGGRKKGIASALGISTGILVHTFFASLGLSIILAKSAAAFNLVKLAGSAYLVIMGIRTILSKDSLFSGESSVSVEQMGRVYCQGILTNVLNPKVALFFLALLPQFVSGKNTYGMLPFLLLGLTFTFTSTLWCLLIASVSSMLSGLLNKSPRISSISNKAAGVIYIALGLKVLTAKMDG